MGMVGLREGENGGYETFLVGPWGPSPWMWVAVQVWKKTGRDDIMSSVLVLVQDGQIVQLRT